MSDDPAPPGPAVDERPAEPRQRWRLTVARGPDTSGATQRDVADAWERGIVEAGLPVARATDARGRLRIAFGAPLPVGVAAEAELLDVTLTERWPRWRVREALEPRLPAGWRLIDLEDVWLAGPALPGRVAAADYRMTLAPDAPDTVALGTAIAALLEASSLVIDRTKGDRTVSVDVRPLILDVGIAAAGPPVIVDVRTRIHPELGSGRPDEIVAILAERLGRQLPVTAVVRERLVLADELDGRRSGPAARAGD